MIQEISWVTCLQTIALVLNETKLDDSFPSAKFSIPDYEIKGGGLIQFVKKGLVCKRLKNFETNPSEWICSDITISEKKWLCFSIYRPPFNENLEIFFEELTNFLSKTSDSYEHVIIMGTSISMLQIEGLNLISSINSAICLI